jgi:hypothetical protein
MQQIVGSGAFQQWLDTAPTIFFSSQLVEFREEGAAYPALQKERFKDEREDTEIQACERALSSVLTSQGAATTDKANLKLPSLLQQEAVLTAIASTITPPRPCYISRDRRRRPESARQRSAPSPSDIANGTESLARPIRAGSAPGNSRCFAGNAGDESCKRVEEGGIGTTAGGRGELGEQD